MGLDEGCRMLAVGDHGGKDKGNLGVSAVGDSLPEAGQRLNVVGVGASGNGWRGRILDR